MSKQELQELNEKLAEWAGFHSVHYRDGETHGYDTKEALYWLQFTQSLDACFKWLVPKIQDDDYSQEVTIYQYPNGWGCYIGDMRKYQVAETPALALCLAIEKLIDSEVGNA